MFSSNYQCLGILYNTIIDFFHHVPCSVLLNLNSG